MATLLSAGCLVSAPVDMEGHCSSNGHAIGWEQPGLYDQVVAAGGWVKEPAAEPRILGFAIDAVPLPSFEVTPGVTGFPYYIHWRGPDRAWLDYANEFRGMYVTGNISFQGILPFTTQEVAGDFQSFASAVHTVNFSAPPGRDDSDLEDLDGQFVRSSGFYPYPADTLFPEAGAGWYRVIPYDKEKVRLEEWFGSHNFSDGKILPVLDNSGHVLLVAGGWELRVGIASVHVGGTRTVEDGRWNLSWSLSVDALGHAEFEYRLTNGTQAPFHRILVDETKELAVARLAAIGVEPVLDDVWVNPRAACADAVPRSWHHPQVASNPTLILASDK